MLIFQTSNGHVIQARKTGLRIDFCDVTANVAGFFISSTGYFSDVITSRYTKGEYTPVEGTADGWHR